MADPDADDEMQECVLFANSSQRFLMVKTGDDRFGFLIQEKPGARAQPDLTRYQVEHILERCRQFLSGEGAVAD